MKRSRQHPGRQRNLCGPRRLGALAGLLCLHLLLAGSLLADTIYLRNGRRIEGDLIGQTRASIRIRVGRRVRYIKKKQIRRITYGLSDSEKARRAAAKKRLAAKQRRLERLRREAAEREREQREALKRKRAVEQAQVAKEADQRARALAERRAEAKRRAEERRLVAERKRDEQRIRSLQQQVAREKRQSEQAEEQRRQLVMRLRAQVDTQEAAVRRREQELAAEHRRLAAEKKRLQRARDQMRRAEQSAEERRRLAKTTPLGAALRSAALPGWGQWYRGHRARGAVFGSLTLALAGGAVAADQAYRSARRSYDANLFQYAGFLGSSIGLSAGDTVALSAFGQLERESTRAAMASAGRSALSVSAVLGLFYLYAIFEAAWSDPALPEEPASGRVARPLPRLLLSISAGRPQAPHAIGKRDSFVRAGATWTF